MTSVTLNGEVCHLPDWATVDTAVRAAGAVDSVRGLAVAVDGEVVPRGQWGQVRLRTGQRVEVLHAVQGG